MRFPPTPTRQARQRLAAALAVGYPYRLACFLQSLTNRLRKIGLPESPHPLDGSLNALSAPKQHLSAAAERSWEGIQHTPTRRGA